jgi:hypothetical protein
MPTLFNRKKPKHKTQATGLVSRSTKNPTNSTKKPTIKKEDEHISGDHPRAANKIYDDIKT